MSIENYDNKIMNSHYNCEPDCQHLDAEYGYCTLYHDSMYGDWFMCDKCFDDTYSS